jgi:hypothetical protein
MRTVAATLLLATGLAAPALAQEDLDLTLIPTATQPPPSAPDVSTAHQDRLFIESDVGLAGRRNDLPLAPPPPAAADATARVDLDLRLHRDWADGLSATVSDRFGGSWQSDLSFPSHRAVDNDLREAYLGLQPADGTFLEAGRINIRNGVAQGYNPTDFFKSRSLVQQANADPQALRNNRLGAFLVHAEQLWDNGSAGLSFAPRLASPGPIQAQPPGGFDPHADRTNASDRLLLTLSQEVADLSPQVLLYHQADRTRYGLNLSHPVGKAVILYAEWAGGDQRPLAAEAIAFGRRTGTLPTGVPLPFSGGDATFRSDATAGLSWTSDSALSINAEIIVHQAGLSRRQWSAWYGVSPQPSLFWYIRSYAADQQEPASQRQAFLRLSWTDVFVPHLDVTAFALTSLADGSTVGQWAATYDLSDRWSLGAYLSANLGGPKSQYGSLPETTGLTFQAIRYF